MKKLGKKFNKFSQATKNAWGHCGSCSCQARLYNSYTHSSGTGY